MPFAGRPMPVAGSMSKMVAVSTEVTVCAQHASNGRHQPSPQLPADEGPDMISSTIADIGAELIDFRRDIHAHPELSFREFETTDKIVARLEAAGLQPRDVEGHGCRLRGRGGAGGRGAACRYRRSARRRPHRRGVPSTVPGVAHACGHDVHLTSLIGAGIALQRIHETTSRRTRRSRPPDLPAGRGGHARAGRCA